MYWPSLCWHTIILWWAYHKKYRSKYCLYLRSSTKNMETKKNESLLFYTVVSGLLCRIRWRWSIWFIPRVQPVTKCYHCTAPITLGTPGFKKIERSILRMLAGGHFSISIYVSNDNKTFYKIISMNINSDTLLSDILLPRIPSSWRNFYLFIEGDMLSDSTITRLDIQEKNTFNTKLRWKDMYFTIRQKKYCPK